jgi:hypothetical protein
MDRLRSDQIELWWRRRQVSQDVARPLGTGRVRCMLLMTLDSSHRS